MKDLIFPKPADPNAPEVPQGKERSMMMEKRRERRAGQLVMTTQVLKNYLKLPEDTNIRDISIDQYRDMVTILVEDGEWLPEVWEGQIPPDVVRQVEE